MPITTRKDSRELTQTYSIPITGTIVFRAVRNLSTHELKSIVSLLNIQIDSLNLTPVELVIARPVDNSTASKTAQDACAPLFYADSAGNSSSKRVVAGLYVDTIETDECTDSV